MMRYDWMHLQKLAKVAKDNTWDFLISKTVIIMVSPWQGSTERPAISCKNYKLKHSLINKPLITRTTQFKLNFFCVNRYLRIELVKQMNNNNNKDGNEKETWVLRLAMEWVKKKAPTTEKRRRKPVNFAVRKLIRWGNVLLALFSIKN
jgi:hypothetical protein